MRRSGGRALGGNFFGMRASWRKSKWKRKIDDMANLFLGKCVCVAVCVGVGVCECKLRRECKMKRVKITLLPRLSGAKGAQDF